MFSMMMAYVILKYGILWKQKKQQRKKCLKLLLSVLISLVKLYLRDSEQKNIQDQLHILDVLTKMHLNVNTLWDGKKE